MSKVNEVELASVRLLLQRALAEKGDGYVYRMPHVYGEYVDDDTDEEVVGWHEAGECQYAEVRFDDNGPTEELVPSCLWGHVLSWMDVPLEELHKREGDKVDAIPSPITDPWVAAAARAAQKTQDSGDTWGAAVAAFEDKIKEADAS